MNAQTGIYLGSLLEPLNRWMSRTDVTDIYINRPGEIWVESLGGAIERFESERLDLNLLMRLARQIAAASAQGISRQHPLLAASLPDGSRVQIAVPPAVKEGIAFAIRKYVSADLSLDDYADQGAFAALDQHQLPSSDNQRMISVGPENARDLLRFAVLERKNILVSGGTSTGKTTFLNALLNEIPREERLITIEDTPELRILHQNTVALIASRSGLSEAALGAEDLLIAALRMRPDRIILGELRGNEAFTFLRSVNTGHPGSMTTIHADTPARAIEQLALLVLQSGTRLHWDDVIKYVRSSVDVFVQLERRNGQRRVSEISYRENR